MGEERPCPPHSCLNLVDAEQRSHLERQLRRRLGEGGLERNHASLSEHGLEQEESRIAGRRERGLEGLDVVRTGERDAGDERAESLPFGRLTGGREGAQRPAVEAALERDDPGAAGRLAGDLERGLVGLGAGVAEEGPATGEALREQGGELQHRLRPVEIGRVPEAVELLVGGRERRRGEVSEADDGDPGHEVEVLAAGVVPDAAAIAPHDRDIGPRVGRQHRVAQR